MILCIDCPKAADFFVSEDAEYLGESYCMEDAIERVRESSTVLYLKRITNNTDGDTARPDDKAVKASSTPTLSGEAPPGEEKVDIFLPKSQERGSEEPRIKGED